MPWPICNTLQHTFNIQDVPYSTNLLPSSSTRTAIPSTISAATISRRRLSTVAPFSSPAAPHISVAVCKKSNPKLLNTDSLAFCCLMLFKKYVSRRMMGNFLMRDKNDKSELRNVAPVKNYAWHITIWKDRSRGTGNVNSSSKQPDEIELRKNEPVRRRMHPLPSN